MRTKLEQQSYMIVIVVDTSLMMRSKRIVANARLRDVQNNNKQERPNWIQQQDDYQIKHVYLTFMVWLPRMY